MIGTQPPRHAACLPVWRAQVVPIMGRGGYVLPARHGFRQGAGVTQSKKQPKTQRNDGDVAAFLAAVADPQRRADAQAVCSLLTDVTGEQPEMWGTSIIGFGALRMRYADGRTAEWPVLGLSPRKQNLTLYLMDGFDHHGEQLSRLGPHRLGKGCLYLKRLDDVDQQVLRELLAASLEASRANEPPA